MCFNVALLLKAKDCDRVFVGNDPVNSVDPWGLMGSKPKLPKMPDNRGDWIKLIKDMKKVYPLKSCSGMEDACWDECQKCCQAVAKLISPLWHPWYASCTIFLCVEQ